MDSFHRLEEIFARFPGIGPRQARRFVYYLINRSNSSINEFIKLVEEVKKTSNECPLCHRIFIRSSDSNLRNESSNICSICSDKSRDKTLLMIIARDSDFETIENSGVYKGLYFILGGTVPILDKEPEKRIRLETLLKRITSPDSSEKEIILSLNTTPEGENTAEIIKKALQKIITERSIKISELGRGLSTGAELEYADRETIKSALKNRG